ncbi:MAG: hypothetical protein HOV66_14400, partial [Streptomycetaceae bacterium]|nr:hypothetical protein [Streptomycetaceae bacterium]
MRTPHDGSGAPRSAPGYDPDDLQWFTVDAMKSVFRPPAASDATAAAPDAEEIREGYSAVPARVS